MISDDRPDGNPTNILLSGDVDEAMWIAFAKQISRVRPTQPIIVNITSDGGDWYYGIAIYDWLKLHPSEVTIRVWGAAMSMATVILQAGDNRLIAPSAELMIHNVHGGKDGSIQDIEEEVSNLNRLRDKMYEIYAEKSGKSVAFWRKKCQKDYYLTAEEALKLGLVDGIIRRPT